MSQQTVLTTGDKIGNVESQGMQFLAQYFASVDSTRGWTIREISEFLAICSVMPKLIGDYRQIADELERWVEEGGVDGFNVFSICSPASYVEFVDLVVPELQRRGRLRTEYEGSTLREHYFGKGQPRLTADHPGSRYKRDLRVCGRSDEGTAYEGAAARSRETVLSGGLLLKT